MASIEDLMVANLVYWRRFRNKIMLPPF